MDPDAVFVIIIVAICAVTSLSLAKLWFNRPGRSAIQSRALEQLEARLTRIEQAIDAVAVETERISEGQRFTTKLLSEKSARGEYRP